MARCPLESHRAVRRLRKSKPILSWNPGRQIRCRNVVDQQVTRINPLDPFAEEDLDLEQPNQSRVRRRRQCIDGGWGYILRQSLSDQKDLRRNKGIEKQTIITHKTILLDCARFR